ncbi:unnamed protein product [Lactuca virosa]|uniref:Bifunctional inhibitor/plant lipid transfer protein/seed storage helical domain-containing protein n=1 Tax=Lactuca virosa TaxID=75947 RepID=A0AAU9P0B4_9ASTR|nr:unnamed protein product [Lactuca virosa]
MASRALATTAFLLTINLLFFTLVSSNSTPKGCPPPPKPPSPGCHCTSPPKPPTPSKPSTPSKPPTPSKPSTPPTPSNPPKATCPKDTLKLAVCANLLNNLLPIVIGTPSKTPCCSLIAGLADLDAAVCLCTAIKANVLGINLNVPVSLSVLLNYCGKKSPSGFQCS